MQRYSYHTSPDPFVALRNWLVPLSIGGFCVERKRRRLRTFFHGYDKIPFIFSTKIAAAIQFQKRKMYVPLVRMNRRRCRATTYQPIIDTSGLAARVCSAERRQTVKQHFIKLEKVTENVLPARNFAQRVVGPSGWS